MGTLVRLVPPAPALAHALDIDEATAQHAFRAEVGYYIDHHLDGRDAEGLADLRRRCAAVVAQVAGVDEERALAALMDAIRFEAWEDAPVALAELRAAGLRLVVVSNWDCSLRSVLEAVGLAEHLDGVVTSAEVGAAKPDRRIFEAALEIAGCAPERAVHVGDSHEQDFDGARAVGIRPVMLDRSGTAGISSLAKLPPLLS